MVDGITVSTRVLGWPGEAGSKVVEPIIGPVTI
jgi:hypothetical protein